jgi:membrane-bound lytic murein transglycosylase D
VRRGDSLSEISDRYGVTMSELKKWNHLRSSKAPMGKKLRIITTESVAYTRKKEPKVDTIAVATSNPIVAAEKSESKVTKQYKEEKVVSYKDVVKMHKVKRGDNLGEIANKYDVAVADVKKWNHLKGNNIPLGKSLKIIKNERVVTTVRKEIKGDKNAVETDVASNDDATEKPSDFYEVQKGDNLFTIAKKFNVSFEDLKKWNNLDNGNIQQGSKLSLASANEKDTEPSYKSEIKTTEYVVERGDNLGEIANKYNVAISDLKDWNNLEDNNDIQSGMKLVVGKKLVVTTDNKSKTTKKDKEYIAAVEKEKARLYYVKKGDSLFSIAKKSGVTVSDIKKWNQDIKVESLKPGMKLKING